MCGNLIGNAHYLSKLDFDGDDDIFGLIAFWRVWLPLFFLLFFFFSIVSCVFVFVFS